MMTNYRLMTPGPKHRYRPVGAMGARVAPMAPPDFNKSVSPISTRVGKTIPTTLLLPPPTPGFSDLPTARRYKARRF